MYSDNRLKTGTTLKNVSIQTCLFVAELELWSSFLTQQVKPMQTAGEELEIITSSPAYFHSKLLLSLFMVFLQVRKTKCKQILKNNKL